MSAFCGHGSYVHLTELGDSGKRLCVPRDTIWYACRFCGEHFTFGGQSVDVLPSHEEDPHGQD